MPVQDNKAGRPPCESVWHAQQEPALLRKVFLCNRHKYRSARFCGQQVVTCGLQMLGFQFEADRHQHAAAVQEEFEIHFFREPAGLRRNHFQISDQLFNSIPRSGK